jgi:uncharacterized ferritin-like protein (DUF455 family)
VLLAFPDAPTEFRAGIARVMADEQRHTRMHMERALRLGLEFGQLPVNCYIWKQTRTFETLLDYIAVLPLVFEARNLDHTLELEKAFLVVNDPRSAAMMRRIHEDEIEHVAFGLHWLRTLKAPSQTEWEAYCAHLKWPMSATKSYGDEFQREARLRSGMTDDFIAHIQALQPPTMGHTGGSGNSLPIRVSTPTAAQLLCHGADCRGVTRDRQRWIPPLRGNGVDRRTVKCDDDPDGDGTRNRVGT